MKKAYYARPISIDNTPQAERDMQLIRDMGFEPYPTGDDKIKVLEEYKKIGMDAFKSYVQHSECIFFRSFPDGSIGAGVYKELCWGYDAKIPVVEIPRQLARRVLSVEDTREMLKELGQR